MPSSRGSSWPRDWTHVSYVSCIGRFFTTCVPCLRGLLWPVAAFLRLSLFSMADSCEASWSGILKDVSTPSPLGTKPCLVPFSDYTGVTGSEEGDEKGEATISWHCMKGTGCPLYITDSVSFDHLAEVAPARRSHHHFHVLLFGRKSSTAATPKAGSQTPMSWTDKYLNYLQFFHKGNLSLLSFIYLSIRLYQCGFTDTDFICGVKTPMLCYLFVVRIVSALATGANSGRPMTSLFSEHFLNFLLFHIFISEMPYLRAVRGWTVYSTPTPQKSFMMGVPSTSKCDPIWE